MLRRDFPLQRGVAAMTITMGTLLFGAWHASGAAERSQFQLSHLAGQHGGAGKLVGGTEIIHLAAHGGRLFAGNGMWMEPPGDGPRRGPQVLVLDRPDGNWRLEHQFAASTLRITALTPVTWTTDRKGRRLERPVPMLLAAPTGRGPEATVYSRDDATAVWTPTGLSALVGPVEVRSLILHRDRVTGVDRVLADSSPAGIVGGVYDPSAAGGIRWDGNVELSGVEKRVMAFAECDGVLHAVAATSMYRRIDAARPKWEKVYTSRVGVINPKNSGLRGLTAIPNPAGKGEVLLAALEGARARVLRLDPADGYQEHVELDVIALLRKQWNVPVSYAIVAYNGMFSVVEPKTGKTVHLLGIEANLGANLRAPTDGRSRPNFYGWETGGWYLIRHADGSYQLRQIVDPSLKPAPILIATRTFAVSPFTADGGDVIYLGGYDANFRPAHNTAWIFRGGRDAVCGGSGR
jgi:hypothetical protein